MKWKSLFSLKVTAWLLGWLLVLLLLMVLIPQENVVGKKTIQSMADRHPLVYTFLLTLGLTHVSTSWLFLASLGFFYIQLVYFIYRFFKVSLARVRFSPKGWHRWPSIAMPQDHIPQLIQHLQAKGFIFHTHFGNLWGVRNRISPLGFILFHISFLFFLPGALLIHNTRFVALLDLPQFQPVSVKGKRGWTQIRRLPPWLPPKISLTLTLTSIQGKRSQGKPVDLVAKISCQTEISAWEEMGRVNHPIVFLGYRFLPQNVDTAVAFRVENLQGYVLDRFALMTQCQGGKAVSFTLRGCELTALPGPPCQAQLSCNGTVWTFPLKKGETVPLGKDLLIVENTLFWGSFLVIYEKGGFWLILGFLLASIGLLFRFLFPRQDCIIEGEKVYFRGEYFPLYFQEQITYWKEELS